METPNSSPLSFFDLSREELAAVLESRLGLPRYRADQLFQWVYQKLTVSPEQMTNIGKQHRSLLPGLLSFRDLHYTNRQVSSDGTRKYLFPVDNDHHVESVMIHQPTRKTLCVSSQVGCALACAFCQTGTMGLIRHLSTGEIIQQVMGVLIDAKNFGDSFQNMVFMGMGEPLHNFDAVSRAIAILSDDFGLALSRRKITVSTVGLVPQIERFFSENVQANLAVSLNATTQEIREQIMPVTKRYSLDLLLQTLRAAPLKPRQRVTIEYVLLGGVNDSDDDLHRLPKLLHGIPSKVNLIPYNKNAGLPFNPPERDLPHRWQKELNQHGLLATIRWSKGQDIDAACGQLVTNSLKAKRAPSVEFKIAH